MTEPVYEDIQELRTKLSISIKLHWVFPLIVVTLAFLTFYDIGQLDALDDLAYLRMLSPVLVPAAQVYFVNLMVWFIARIAAMNPVRVRALLTLQFAVDVVLTTYLVESFVGVESVFTFLYPLIIFMAGLFISREVGLLMATLSSIFYAGLILLGYFGWLDSSYYAHTQSRYADLNQEDFIYFGVATKIIFFHVMALTAGGLKTLLDRTHRELLRSKLETETVLRSMPAGLVAVDTHGKIARLNGRGGQLLRRLGCLATIGDEAATALPAEFSRYLTKALTEGLVCNARVQVPVDGDELHFELQAAALRSAGESIGGILIFNDISSAVLLQQQLERNQRLTMVGKMSANVAFGVRGPIRSALRYAEAVVARQRQEKVLQGEMTMLEGTLRRADQALARILELTHSADRQPARVELLPLLQRVHDQRAAELKGKRIAWTVAGEPAAVHGDAESLLTVFNNLLDNAVAAMPSGGDVRFLLGEQAHPDEPETMVTVRVSDTGVGISQEHQGRIFDPFFTTGGEGKNGLGLTIAAKLIDDHGGYLMLEESRPGQTVFLVLLPAAPAV